MLHLLIPDTLTALTALVGILFAFAATVFATNKLQDKLPKDGGREFAHDGKLSAGKPRGAGIIFVLCYVISALIFAPLSAELVIYLILTVICMMTGYLDDASKMPWGEYKKGFLDLCVALMVAFTYLKYNTETIRLPLMQLELTIPPVIFAILVVILVWTSVNVTNCADGVDGLSGTLTLVTITTIYVIYNLLGTGTDHAYFILLFAVCILGYLWYNATPSKLMMGDAGSRAMGLFISIAVLKSGAPLLYIPVAFVLMMDGGLGLVKVALLRFLKIRILTNVKCPLHDQVRKVWGWSNTQAVFRFAIIQIIISLAVIYGLRTVL